MANKITTPVGVLSFPCLFEPKAAVPGAEPRYSLNLVFDKTAQATKEFKALVAAVEDEAKTFFGGKPPAGWRNPIRDAGEKEYAGYNPGDKYISCWSKSKPGIIGPRLEDIELPEEVFAGQKARATIRPFGYNQIAKGVGLGLLNVQIAKKDAVRLDGRMSAREEFSALEEETEDFPI